MAEITGLTAERMLEIEAASVVDGNVVDDDLILEKHDGTQINAGNVRGPQGDGGIAGGAAFPVGAVDGDVFIRTDMPEDSLFKYTNGKWLIVPTMNGFYDDFSVDTADLYEPYTPGQPWTIVGGRLRPAAGGGAWQGLWLPVPALMDFVVEMEYFTGSTGGRGGTAEIAHRRNNDYGIRSSMQGWDNALNTYRREGGADNVMAGGDAGGEAIPQNQIRYLTTKYQSGMQARMSSAYYTSNPIGGNPPAANKAAYGDLNPYNRFWFHRSRLFIGFEDVSMGIESIRISLA